MIEISPARELDSLIAAEVMQWKVVNPCSNFYGRPGRPKENNIDFAYVSNCICDVLPVIHEPEDENDLVAELMTNQNREEHEGDLAIWGHNRSCLKLIPNFSTKWSDMEIVVRMLRERGYYFNLEAPIIDCQQPGWLATFEYNFVNYTEGADTAPYAVCLAALAAVRGNFNV